MKNLKIEKYSILGTSGGGITALLYSIKYPQNVDKLIVVAAHSFILKSEIEVYESLRNTANWKSGTIKPLNDFYGVDYVQDTWSRFTDILWRIYEERNGNYCHNEIHKITAQTLIILGEKDVMIDLSHAKFFKDSIKDCKVVIFPKGGHKMHLKFVDEFDRLVSDFLEFRSML